MYGHRARIGYTSPPMVTEVFPYEFYQIAPRGVTLAVTTLAVLQVTSEEVNESAQISLRAAKEMALAGVDLVVLGGIPINLTVGSDKVVDLISHTATACGVPVTTSVTAQVNALRKLNAHRVGVVVPGSASDTVFLGFLKDFGFEVAGVIGADRTLYEWGRMSSDVCLELAKQLIRDHPEADTIYLPCPHWPVNDQIATMERELGRNVVGASQAIIWESLRLCGIAEPIDGYGRLLRDF